jgi:hypothetical protein
MPSNVLPRKDIRRKIGEYNWGMIIIYGQNDRMPIPKLAIEVIQEDALTFSGIAFSFGLFTSVRAVPQLRQEIASSWFRVPHCGQYMILSLSIRLDRRTG